MKSVFIFLFFIAGLALVISCSRTLNEPNQPPSPTPPNQNDSNAVDTLIPKPDSLNIMHYRPVSAVVHNLENGSTFTFTFRYDNNNRLTSLDWIAPVDSWNFTYASDAAKFPSSYTHSQETRKIVFNQFGLPVEDTVTETLYDYPFHFRLFYDISKVLVEQYTSDNEKIYDYTLQFDDTASEKIVSRDRTRYNDGFVNPIISYTYNYTDTLNPFFRPEVAALIMFPDSEGERDQLLFKNLLRSQSIYAYESFENPTVLHYEYTIDSVGKLTGIEQWIVDLGGRKTVKTWEISY